MLGKIKKNGVSLMVSYVLLVVIALALSIGIYTWLKATANVEPTPACPKGVAIIISDYNCETSGEIEITIKNKGTHNISGFVVRVSKNIDSLPAGLLLGKEPYALDIYTADRGHYNFMNPLPPGEEKIIRFKYPKDNQGDSWLSLKKIQIEPYRTFERNQILCEEAAITQELMGC